MNSTKESEFSRLQYSTYLTASQGDLKRTRGFITRAHDLLSQHRVCYSRSDNSLILQSDSWQRKEYISIKVNVSKAKLATCVGLLFDTMATSVWGTYVHYAVNVRYIYWQSSSC